MSDELAKLRADLATIKAAQEIYSQDYPGCDAQAMIGIIEAKIARLETEAVDPWREARGWISSWHGQGDFPAVVAYVDHLTAENARLAARVAELESVASDVTSVLEITEEASLPGTDAYTVCVIANEIISDGGRQLREWARCPDPDDPILDPARVLTTAAAIMDARRFGATADSLRRQSGDAKPYRLKGDDDV